MANHSQTVVTVAIAAFSSGWLSGLYFARRLPRDQDPDFRRSFNHENVNSPSGPPPLKFRRRDADPPEQCVRMDEGRIQRGNGVGAPTTSKPNIIPKPQQAAGYSIRRGSDMGYQQRQPF